MIASHVNDLNSEGAVKAQTGNEKGYAKLCSISNGCRVWAHHTLEDKLIVDLLVTRSAASTHPDVVATAVATFDRFAKDSGYSVSQRPWQHAITKSDTRQQYYFDITSLGEEDIMELVDKVRTAFRHETNSPN